MTDRDIKEEDIPGESPFTVPAKHKHSCRYFTGKAFAWFSCPNKHKYWPSAHSRCFLDLKTQTLCFRYTQECNRCDDGAAVPGYPATSVKIMAERAVNQYLIKTGKLRIDVDPSINRTEEGKPQSGPHDEQRCSKCQELGRQLARRIN